MKFKHKNQKVANQSENLKKKKKTDWKLQKLYTELFVCRDEILFGWSKANIWRLKDAPQTHRLNEVVFGEKTSFHHCDTVYLRALDYRVCGGSFQLFRVNGNENQNLHRFISALNFWIIHSSFLGFGSVSLQSYVHCYQLSQSQTDFHISIVNSNE